MASYAAAAEAQEALATQRERKERRGTAATRTTSTKGFLQVAAFCKKHLLASIYLSTLFPLTRRLCPASAGSRHEIGAMMYDEICYEKPFLKEAIARIDFFAPLEDLNKELPPKLARAVSTHFPISEPTEAIAQQLQLSGEGLSHHQTRFKQWNFFGKEREKQLALAAPWVFVTYSRYTTFEDMKEQFAAVVEAVGKAFPDAKAGRFGLRYINLIEISDLADPTSWGDYITPQLLETMAFFRQPRLLTRLIQVAELKYEDLDLRFQFGMPNPDYPAIMRRSQFVLDIDAYVQTAHDLGDSFQHMEQAHGLIQDLFERSITENLRRRMNARSVPVQE